MTVEEKIVAIQKLIARKESFEKGLKIREKHIPVTPTKDENVYAHRAFFLEVGVQHKGNPGMGKRLPIDMELEAMLGAVIDNYYREQLERINSQIETSLL